MITINLDEFAAEDFKQIQNLRKMCVPEELIQFAYNNTKEKREKEKEDGRSCVF